MNKTLKSQLPLHIMMMPALIILLIFNYTPMVGIIIAFQDYIPSSGLGVFFKSDWVGLENFKYILSMPDTKRVLENTVFIALYKIIAGISVPLILALLLNEIQNKAFKKAAQTIVYIPFFLSWVILSGILIDILSPSSGIINKILMVMNIDPIYFLGDPDKIRGVLVVSNIWKEVGYNMVIFLAAITSIDKTPYEAAKVDGAGELQQLFYITLPSLKPIIILVTVLSLGNILNAGFDQVFNLYSPIVYEKADIIDTFVYRIGMLQLQYSVATAVGVLKSIVSLVFISLSFYMAKKFANYRLF